MQLDQIVNLAGEIYVIGLQISSPVVGALFVAQIALGMVARAAPQMNVFMISFPMNLGIGLLMLGIAADWIMRVLDKRFEINIEQLKDAIDLLRPT
jgi:flagellar biosynthesis protein FliR